MTALLLNHNGKQIQCKKSLLVLQLMS
jgi:hypothetical protein